MIRAGSFFCLLLLVLVLPGCSHQPCVRWPGAAAWCAAALPAQPAFASREDIVSADARGQKLQAMASTEWTATRFTQVVLTPLGQRLYRLQYDGRQLQFERGLLPVPILPEQSLLDIQLMLWPLELLQANLPRGWQLQEQADTGRRELRAGEELLAEVHRLAPDELELIQYRLGYRVRVQTLDQQANLPVEARVPVEPAR
ncbi:DUF3261 domain-containing protein [Permianibacter sp. IMCC34836]|uniref:DUF3261 domain-containing protein n=1 Tax=Permianibacter fluminis TaxID=2738515 RepID=UPI001553ED02|nr:DUF3261 domain-containing protein [Permianibacter fluminis]NQD35543.1 DUF3261 domain-containing protein [Permianibacter fluminis]